MESLRPLLITYAYNILGSVEEAKDVVQEVFLKFMQQDGKEIQDEKAYLVRMVVNLSINQKKRQKKIVADYPGPWLPEPVATEKADTSLLRKDVLSYSLMVLLEKLNARQRAVFILKEAFDYDHDEIAEVLDITADNSRKILSRAKIQLHADSPAEEKSIPVDYLNKYLNVISSGDTDRLEKLLAEDIVIVSDGGGKAAAFMNPIEGKESVMAALLGLHRKFYEGAQIEQGSINHQPALFYYKNGEPIVYQIFSIVNGMVDHIFFIRNPDKLKVLEK